MIFKIINLRKKTKIDYLRSYFKETLNKDMKINKKFKERIILLKIQRLKLKDRYN